MKYINRKQTVEPLVAIGPISISEPPVKKKTKPLVKVFWYRVAIMYNPDHDFYYTKVVDKQTHQVMIEGEQNFVRWEKAVEYTV